MMGFYRGILKYAGVDLLLQIACGTLGGTGITYLVSFLCYSIRREPNIFLMPRPVYLVQWLLLMVMLAASRFVIKVAQGGGWTHFFTGGSAKARRVMVVGGGWGGAQVIRDMQAGRYGDCVPVIVVDDDDSRRNTRIGRVRVVMDTGKIAEYAKQYAIDDIIIAIATPKSDLTELMHTCVDTGCHVRRYTVMQEMNGGQGADARHQHRGLAGARREAPRYVRGGTGDCRAARAGHGRRRLNRVGDVPADDGVHPRKAGAVRHQRKLHV